MIPDFPIGCGGEASVSAEERLDRKQGPGFCEHGPDMSEDPFEGHVVFLGECGLVTWVLGYQLHQAAAEHA